MKKFFYLFSLIMCLASCSSCNKEAEISELNVESSINLDKEYMFADYGNNYKWYETCILLENYLDEENDGLILSVSNVFQVITSTDSTSYDTEVILATHTLENTYIETKQGFWVEDFALNDCNIKVSFKSAFEKLMQSNFPKPHSRHCVLRKQVGPIESNPQYIFGNQHAQLYVDAITGNITDKNPAFPED